jgi:hypothetical protein
MVNTPVWQAPSAGFAGNAGHVNQFLGSHAARVVYNGGTVTTQQATGSANYVSSQGTFMSQTFTVPGGQTAIGSINLQINAVGGSPTLPLIPQLTVGLYASSSGLPTGSAIVSATLQSTYIYSAPFWVNVALPLSPVTSGSIYAIVLSSAGTASHYYAVQRSNQTSGAATSPDGVTWTPQAYGFMYQVLDQSGSASGPVQTIYEDNGARVVQFFYNTNGTISKVVETTLSQSSSAPLISTRNLSYVTGLLTGAS